MPTLLVGDGFETALPGLGRKTEFSNLTEQTVTRAVREALHKQYGRDHVVEVSGAAYFMRGEWVGEYRVDHQSHSYRVRE